MYVEEKIIRLQLWDTAGQERFKSLIPSYIKDSAVAIVVYDVTSKFFVINISDKNSFNSVQKWIEDARSLRGDDVLIMLVGNKTDLGERRQVSTEEGEKLSKDHDALFFESSAKTGTNIKNIFNELARKLTGVETNPIAHESEVVNPGLVLKPDNNAGQKENATGKKSACC